jgi:hypothetical protein
MAEDDQARVAPPAAERPRYRQLSVIERAGAIVFGVGVASAGLVAMFSTDNEAGVAVAIVLGGVLVVLGIQGTQLGKLGGKDFSAELMVREERREVATITKAIADEEPDRAQAMLDGFEIADPGSRFSAEVVEARGYVYDNRVLQVLAEQFGSRRVKDFMHGLNKPTTFTGGVDFDDGVSIAVTSARHGMTGAWFAHMARKQGMDGVFIVDDRPKKFLIQHVANEGVPVGAFLWSGDAHEAASVAAALEDLYYKVVEERERNEPFSS